MLTSTMRKEEMKMKWRNVEDWMSSHFLPRNKRRRIRQHEQYNWIKTKAVEVENLIDKFPKDLRRDIKRHLFLGLLNRVPLFEIMDSEILDEMCAYLKPALYTGSSHITLEGDQVDEMHFIMQGELQSISTNNGRTGFFNMLFLKEGDFCGEELLTWALDLNPSILPRSTSTVQALTEVEAFALRAYDLKLVMSKCKQHHSSEHIKHAFRYYSIQWRTWAACYIQAAWCQFRKRKLKTLRQRRIGFKIY